MKKMLVSWYSDEGWQGNIVAYRDLITGKIISKNDYHDLLERELLDMWYVMDDDEKEIYDDFEDFRKTMLTIVDREYEPLVEIFINEDEERC